MNIISLTESLKLLKPDEHRVIYTGKNGTQVIVKHTAKLSPKDFAVGLIIPKEPEFYPTHVRLLIDLFIKKESNKNDAHKLGLLFEKMFKGEDPKKLASKASKLSFRMQFDDPDVNLYYAQLLMIEQDINYGPGMERQSRMNPPREYLMRFVRWVLSGDNQIDRIIFAAAGRRYPAPEKYGKPIV